MPVSLFEGTGSHLEILQYYAFTRVCVFSMFSVPVAMWKIRSTSWECYRDQHLHTPHKTGMWKTDRQTLALANT